MGNCYSTLSTEITGSGVCGRSDCDPPHYWRSPEQYCVGCVRPIHGKKIQDFDRDVTPEQFTLPTAEALAVTRDFEFTQSDETQLYSCSGFAFEDYQPKPNDSVC